MSEAERERPEAEADRSGEDPRVLRTRGPASPAERRAAARGGGSLDWVHRFRVTPVTLLLIVAVLGALWALLEFTGLWYRLFP
jgi:hypothetical protein